MAVDTAHPDYDRMLSRWEMMRDVSADEEQVKSKGTKYLPKLGGQDDEEYKAYKQRASFFNATARTIDGLSGMIFRKPPIVNVPGAMEGFTEDVTMEGVSLQEFAEMLVDEELTVTRSGVLVDFPNVDTQGLTQEQAEQINLRPSWSLYKTESILYWRVGQVNNRTTLTQVRLLERIIEPGEDEFEEEEIEQIRVLDLTDVYRQRVFRKDRAGEWVQHEGDIIPKMGGRPLDFIPFVFFGARDTTPRVDKPLLIDLGYKNLDHYRQNADWQHARHFLAAGMTYWGAGINPEEIEKGNFDATGPTNIWLTSNADAKFGVVEFTGAGMRAMENGMAQAEQQMALLGARMLAPEKRQAEAAETAQIHRQGETSVLASLANSISVGMTQLLEITRDWMGISGDVLVELNSDFDPTDLDPRIIAELSKNLMSGSLSFESFFYNLKRGELYKPGWTMEDEQAALETSSLGMGELRGIKDAS